MISEEKDQIESEELLVSLRHIGDRDTEDSRNHRRSGERILAAVHLLDQKDMEDDESDQSDDPCCVQTLKQLVVAVNEHIRCRI